MKKKTTLFAVVAILMAATWTVLAWKSGDRVQASVARTVEELNRRYPGEVQWVIVDYSRGIFSSRWRVQVEGRGSEPAQQIDGVFEHGPWPLGRLLAGQLAPVLAAGEAVLPPDLGPLARLPLADPAETPRASAVVQLDGTLTFQLAVPALSGPWSTGLRVESTAFVIQGSQAPDAQAIAWQAQVDSLRLGSQQTEAADWLLQGVTLAGSTQPGRLGWPLGELRLATDTLQAYWPTQGGGVPVVARQAQVTLRTTEQPPFLDFALHVDSGAELSAGQTPVGRIEADFSTRRLRVNALHEGLLIYLEREKAAPEATRALRRQQFADAMSQVVLDQPLLAVDRFAWQAPAGSSDGQLLLGVMPSQRGVPPVALEGEAVSLSMAPVFAVELSGAREALHALSLALLQATPQGQQASAAELDQAAGLQVGRWFKPALSVGLARVAGDRIESHVQWRPGQGLQVDGRVLSAQEEEPAAMWLLSLVIGAASALSD